MTEIDREIGGSIMIRVSTEVRQMIEEEKIIPREPLNDCIKRGILENRRTRALLPSIDTRDAMAGNIADIIRGRAANNPLYPGHDEVVHHINGNHNDDRPENLAIVKRCDHPKLHSDIGLLGNKGPTKGDQIVGKNV